MMIMILLYTRTHHVHTHTNVQIYTNAMSLYTEVCMHVCMYVCMYAPSMSVFQCDHQTCIPILLVGQNIYESQEK